MQNHIAIGVGLKAVFPGDIYAADTLSAGVVVDRCKIYVGDSSLIKLKNIKSIGVAKSDWSTLDHNTLDKMKVEHRENRYVNKYDGKVMPYNFIPVKVLTDSSSHQDSLSYINNFEKRIVVTSVGRDLGMMTSLNSSGILDLHELFKRQQVTIDSLKQILKK